MNYYQEPFEASRPELLEDYRMEDISAPAINRYVNILLDKWFKRILGSEANKEALLGILRELIPERNIRDIRYDRKRKRKKNPYVDGHDAIFDVECIDDFGARFVVEMQMEEQVHFPERALFYSTFPIQEQVSAQKKMMPYRSHDEQYVFPPVYVISFLNFSLHYDSDKILYRYELTEEESGELMTDRLHFLFLEMTNCPSRKPQSRDSFIEKLSYALTHMQWLKERPAELSEQVFGLLFEACEITSLNKETQQEYTNDIMTTEMDRKNILYTRELRGYERGQMDGREEGREEGFEEGRKEERINNARNLKALGVDMAIIAKATGLLEDQIEAL
jgi:predicted transposase/invertase (TIGR01784 family)